MVNNNIVNNNALSIAVEQQAFFMNMALRESVKAIPACLPNPPVGCVLVKKNYVIATGYTREPGGNHAEADALSKVSGLLEDVSAFVTLEPCSFHGLTPSCAKSLINRKINAVYIALIDPDPRNSGRGIALLEEAGIAIVKNVLSIATAKFLLPYLYK